MEPTSLLVALIELAEQVGLRVDRVHRGNLAESLGPAVSGRCVLRGEVWVLLADGDPLPHRVSVLGAALREHAGGALEARYLAPALREAIFPEG